MKTMKFYLKLIMLAAVVSFISCEKEVIDNQLTLESNNEKNNDRYSLKIATSNEVPVNSNGEFINSNLSGRAPYTNTDYDFEIDVDLGYLIIDNFTNLKSYTFNILNRDFNDVVENIVLTETEEGIYLAGKIIYKFTDNDYLNKETIPLDYTFTYIPLNIDSNVILNTENSLCDAPSYDCTEIWAVTTTTTQIYPDCDVDHGNGHTCEEQTITTTSQVLLGSSCTLTFSECPGGDGGPIGNNPNTFPNHGGPVSNNNPIATSPSTVNPHKIRAKSFVINLPENLKECYNNLSAETQNSIGQFLESTLPANDPFMLSYSDQALDIVEGVLDIMCEDDSLSFEGALDLLVDTDQAIHSYVASLIVVDSPEVSIVNLADYLDCFDLTQGAKVTISSDQPNPNNSDDDVILTNSDVGFIPLGYSVGHSFVTIEQGANIASFGFYPASGMGYPNSSPGVMGNDQNHTLDVSISINVDSGTLSSLINESIAFSLTNYNLTENNCTDFAIAAANTVGFDINTYFCIGNYFIGSGATPGKFGDYLKILNLPPSSTGVAREIGLDNSPANNGCN